MSEKYGASFPTKEPIAACTCQHIHYRPTGNNKVGFREKWMCSNCGREFVKKELVKK